VVRPRNTRPAHLLLAQPTVVLLQHLQQRVIDVLKHQVLQGGRGPGAGGVGGGGAMPIRALAEQLVPGRRRAGLRGATHQLALAPKGLQQVDNVVLSQQSQHFDLPHGCFADHLVLCRKA